MARPRGRKPAPTYLKLVKDVRKHRINSAEAKVPTEHIPEPPDHLSEEALLEWSRVCGRLYRAGLLTEVDQGILAAYCTAYGRWVIAERALSHFRSEMEKKGDPSHGLMMTTINGNLIQNPLVGTANKAMQDMARYATDLGMTPSARSRVTAKPPESDEDPADRYLA